MSNPVLIAGSYKKWDVLLGIVVGLGGIVAAAGFWRDLMPVSPVIVLVGVALILIGASVWIVRITGRKWCEIRPDGFLLRDARGEEELRDDDVFAMSLAT